MYNNEYLYSKSKTGKILEWKASTDFKLDSNNYVVITVEWGQQNGKKQTKTRFVKSGKNLGKKNETSIIEQAQLELKYLYQDQLDKNYYFDLSDYQDPKTPMLAHKFKDKVHKILLDVKDEFIDPYVVQPKLNGVRCLAIITEDDQDIVFLSRSGKAFRHFPLIDKKLKELFNVGDVIDGELFHPNIPFENIITLVNSDDDRSVTDSVSGVSWESKDIQYHVYDIVPLGKESSPYKDRFIPLYNTLSKRTDLLPLHMTATYFVKTFDDVKSWFKKFMSDKYEGLMLRNANSIYEYGIRSLFLLKYKEMEQEEFLILNIYLAENDSNKVMLTLVNHHNPDSPEYATFDCALKGDKDENMKYFFDKDNHISKSWMTVDYQVLSSYKVPLFPVGVIIRQGVVVNGKFEPAI